MRARRLRGGRQGRRLGRPLHLICADALIELTARLKAKGVRADLRVVQVVGLGHEQLNEEDAQRERIRLLTDVTVLLW